METKAKQKTIIQKYIFLLKEKKFTKMKNKVNIIKKVLPNLKKNDGASVVLFSTVAVKTGMPMHSSIAAAKGAVEGLAKSLAAELAPRVAINCIAPSIVDTKLAANILSTDERKQASADRHPLKFIGTPKLIAQSAYQLLAAKENWITGQIIAIQHI